MENCLLNDSDLQQSGVLTKKKTGIGKLFNVFREPKSKPLITDPKKVKDTYTFWRISIFISIYTLYFVSYLSRKNLSVAMSPMTKSLGISSMALGILASVFYVTYGLGKFINGVLADKSNVRTFLPATIAVSGLASAGMALSGIMVGNGYTFGISSMTFLVWSMAFFWGLNGWFQSAAFPLCGKSLTFWFSNKERAVKWSWWSTSHEFGSSAALLLSSVIIVNWGWKASFYVPAIISIVICAVAVGTLRDKPKSMGLPEIEDYHHTHTLEREHFIEEEDNIPYKEVFSKHILRNKNMWILAASFIFVYILRFGPLDWCVKYFIEVNGDSPIAAAVKACFIPLFGSIGTLSIPYVSNKLFGGRRAPANFFYLILAVVSLLFLNYKVSIDLFLLPVTSVFGLTQGQFGIFLEYLSLALLGIATCGPLVLIGGLCSVESTSKRVAAASTGFTGAAGYIGAIISALVAGKVLDMYKATPQIGFQKVIWFWIFSALAGALLCIPLWNKRSKL